MNFSKFDEILAAAEIDPRPRAKRMVRNITNVKLRGIDDGIADQIAGSRLEAVAQRIATAVERGNFSVIDDLVNAFELDLAGAIQRERTTGRLKPWSAQDEFKKFASELDARGWRGRILEHLRAMLQPDERIRAVEYFAIVTDQRRLARSEIKERARTVTETNDANFERQFMSDEQVRTLEADAHEQAAKAARAPWSNNFNRDLRVRA